MSTSIRDPEKFMHRLLDLLTKARTRIPNADNESVDSVLNKFKEIEDELNNMKGLLPTVNNWESNLLNQFNTIERLLGKITLGPDSSYSTIDAISHALDRILGENIKKIQESDETVKLMPAPKPLNSESTTTHRSQLELVKAAGQNVSEEWSELGMEDRIYLTPTMIDIRMSYDHLESMELKLCFLCFSVFPENCVIKKRPLIYWWIGEGFIASTQHKTAEEVGEEIFNKLIALELIQACDDHANSCTMHPWIRRMLLFTAKRAMFFDINNVNSQWPSRRACLVYDNKPVPRGENDPEYGNLLTVFNLNNQYLSFKPDWLSRLKKLVVLQLGRWQSSAKYHIEVDDEDFIKGLGRNHKHLKYLSLRGISRITEIPSSILDLVNLKILDLRACHNLETLPSDISSLKKLTHLDISECYLLEGMPKGIDKLSSLQVLKGYVIGTPRNTPFRLGDLANLKNLRRLSIHMNNEAVIQTGELSELEKISSLRRLKISWGVVTPELKEKIALQSSEFSFPQDLEKLDLQGIPIKEVPSWLKPRQLKNLKKLYIRGGELSSLDHAGEGDECRWRVEILRLKYLNNMKIGLPAELKKDQFPHLRYMEKVKCHDIGKDNEYDEDIVWSELAEN